MNFSSTAMGFVPQAARAPADVRSALIRRALLACDDPYGKTLACESGCLWVSFEGCSADLVLEAGQTLTCSQSGRMIVQALRDSELVLR